MTGRLTSRSERLFAWMLRAFPADFRQRFGADMQEVFADQLNVARVTRGGLWALWIRVLPSFLWAALAERFHGGRLPDSSHSDRRRPSMFSDLGSDARHAVRLLRRSPVFSATSILIIALGVAAVTTTFSAMEALLLRAVPGTRDTDRVMSSQLLAADGTFTMTASPELIDHWRTRARLVEGVAGHTGNELTLMIEGAGVAAAGGIVTAGFLELLNVSPQAGRFFSAADDSVGSAPVAVLSHALWQSRYAADPAVVGRGILINGHAATIIGVAHEGFVGAMAIVPEDLWITKGAAGQVLPNRRSWLRPVVRVRDGVTIAAAERELSALLAQRAKEAEPLPDGVSRTVVRLSAVRAIPADARGDFAAFLGLLLGAATLVLIIASVNVGTMLSARSVARHREMALRTALGARRGRLIRQLLTESILLYTAGGVAGAFAAVQFTQAVERVPVPIDANLQLEISPNATVFLFALGAALLTGLLFGLGPAFTASRTDVTSKLRDDSAGGGRRRSRTSNVLIAGQLAASLVLLVCASLFNRALSSGRTMDTGFDMNDVATIQLRASQWGYDEPAIRALQSELRERVRSAPGVADASFTDRLPLTAKSEGGSFFITGRTPALRPDGTPAGEQLSLARVDESFFSILRMPMRAGRGFSAADGANAPRVAVINETMAAQFWAPGTAVGQTFVYRDSLHTIIGVVRDARYQSLSDPVPPVVYFPLSQHWQADQLLMVRGDAGAANVGRIAAEQLALMAPEVPRPPVIPLRRASGIVLIPQQIAAVATGAMGLVGLLLATVGLYGIVAYSVGRRTREFGVRMAVGAREGDVLRMVVGEGLYLTIVGVSVGLLIALAASRLVSAFLLSVNPLDPVTFLAVPSVFVIVALLASYFPARRAARLNPISALRSE